MKNSLRDLFEYPNSVTKVNTINDYEIFKDKDLLDDLRTRIVENIIDTNIPSDEDLTEYINNEIDKTIEGYDLSNLERSHLFNLIDTMYSKEGEE